MTDSLSARDADYRRVMTAASTKLAKAMWDARAGVCPATPLEPVKLPQDQRVASENGRKGSAVLPNPESPDEAVLRMFSQGCTPITISRRLGWNNHQQVQGVLRRLKNDKPGRYWRAVERHNFARGIVQ